ncbi:hypothetical protein ID866_2204 [Astraeus odoratus]|nr:hypothetical protein ID866_2204 [Astraeus odoratus]
MHYFPSLHDHHHHVHSA